MRVHVLSMWVRKTFTLLVLLTIVCPMYAICSDNGFLRRGSLTSSGSFYIEWWLENEPVPLNEIFAMHFLVLDPEDRKSPVANAVVTVSTWMPEHNHGATIQPQVKSYGDGRATASGLLLHMEGKWELRVAVVVGGQMERANFTIYLEP